MPQGDYLGMTLTVLDLDQENLAYFQHCADHDFHLQQCADPDCALIRYPPGTACPWCSGREFNWVPVDARGAVHSYGEVHHAIQPAFRERAPYMILLVELDTQSGVPTEHEALRVAGNLVDADGTSPSPIWSGRSVSARACAWSSPMSPTAWRCRTGRSTKTRTSPRRPGATRRKSMASRNGSQPWPTPQSNDSRAKSHWSPAAHRAWAQSPRSRAGPRGRSRRDRGPAR